jgi:hypothetical protein
MRMVPACCRALAAGAVLAWAVAPALLSAAPAAPDKDDKTASSTDKVRADLDKAITIKFEKQPLNVAVEMLKEKSKIKFDLDSVTIQQQLGATPDMLNLPVDAEFKDRKVRSVLQAILSPYNLSFVPIGDSVLITTEDQAVYRQLHQRVNVDFTKVEFAAALKQLAKDTSTNLLLDSRAEKDASAKVSLQLEDAQLDTAVRLLAEMANLKPVRVGNVLFVTKKEIANELRNDPDLAQPGQPGGQPVPPGGVVPPLGIAPNPPPVITAPNPPATVPPAVDPDKPAPDKPPPAADDKPKDEGSKPKDADKKDGDK